MSSHKLLSRRQFLKAAAGVGASLAAGTNLFAAPQTPILENPTLEQRMKQGDVTLVYHAIREGDKITTTEYPITFARWGEDGALIKAPPILEIGKSAQEQGADFYTLINHGATNPAY